MAWRFKRFAVADVEDEAKKTALAERRDRAVGIFQKLALQEQNNAVEAAQRQVCYALRRSIPPS